MVGAVVVIAAGGVGAFLAVRDDGDAPGATEPNASGEPVDSGTPSVVTTESGQLTVSLPTTSLPSVALPSVALPSVTPSSVSASPTAGLPPGVPPQDLGNDRALDALAQDCYDGNMTDCDELYDASPAGSPYEVYGDTCAQRQPANTGLLCTSVFPNAAPITG